MPALRLATLALAISLVAGAGVAAEPFRIIVTSTEVPLVPNSVLYLAQTEGYFERAGVEVELIAVEQTPMAVTALRTGAGEMANISLDALLGLHVGEDRTLKAVGSSDKAIPYIIAGGAGITLESLSGGTFGVGRPNSLDHTMSTLVLQRQGVPVDSLEIIPLGQPDVRAQALVQGRVDATTMSIGVFMSIPQRDDLSILVDVEDYFAAAPIVTKVNVVSQKVLTERADDLDAVLEALTLAARDFANTPATWVDAMHRARPDVDIATLEALAPIYARSWTVNGGLQLVEANYSQVWLYQTDRFAGAFEVSIRDWADFAPMDRVLGRIGTSELGDPVSR